MATAVLRARPRCGAARVVAVDGHAGAGKSTLAERLAEELGGAPVVHTDDLATHEEPFGWAGRLAGQVLAPLSEGRPVRHDVYDWHARTFATVREVPPAPVVLVEGVGSGQAAVRPYLALTLWLEVPPHEARVRGRRRDGPELEHFWNGWTRAEDEHFAADPTRPFADLLVRQDRPAPGGYTALPGPAARTRGDRR
ncbi:uridine kinase family protein [Actinacidiphila yeochonensis]|uniref:uridine kinase family protein n=1 Tax=Actinacidiphila yeochonensis TaxID=89050 RepID=UPI00056A83B3|nr:AAA family ATPase [Actinacidiphila yeochonensis]